MAIPDTSVQEFYPALFFNMGQSYELLGNVNEAKRYYDLAAKLGVVHQVEKKTFRKWFSGGQR